MAEPKAAGRRRLLRLLAALGVAPAVGELWGAEAQARVGGEQADRAILQAAVALEHHAIALYDVGLSRKLVPVGLRRYAIEFRGDHQGHRDTQIGLLEERGGAAPVPLQRYVFGPLLAGDAFVRQLLEIEWAAQRAYQVLASQIGTQDYLLSAAFILIDEVRHVTVWRRVLGVRIY